MSEKAVRRVAVIGAGSMGHAIAQIMAMAGYEVSMTDVNREFMQKGYDRIKWSLEKFVEKRTIRQEEMDAALARVKLVDGYANTVANADFVIEAAPEDLELKKKIFH